MNSIEKARFISIWIFIVPFVAVNACLILVTQFHGVFESEADRLYNTIPYIDGGASISRTARPCLLYTSPSPRDATLSRMPSSA